MSEKRFKKRDTIIIDPFPILDTVEEVGYNCTDTLDLLVDLLNEQQDTIIKLGQRDYYNQSERYKILSMAIELTINYIANSYEEHYDIGALITEFEEELLESGR